MITSGVQDEGQSFDVSIFWPYVLTDAFSLQKFMTSSRSRARISTHHPRVVCSKHVSDEKREKEGGKLASICDISLPQMVKLDRWINDLFLIPRTM